MRIVRYSLTRKSGTAEAISAECCKSDLEASSKQYNNRSDQGVAIAKFRTSQETKQSLDPKQSLLIIVCSSCERAFSDCRVKA